MEFAIFSNTSRCAPNQPDVVKILRTKKHQKLPTFNQKFESILQTVKPFWNLPYLLKDTAISMITGFIEKQDKTRLKSSESQRCFKTLASPAIRSYIEAETKLQRLVRIDNPEALFDPTEIVMSRCLALKKPEKDEYRFVYDNTCCNEFILPTGCFQNGPISFTTPSIETLLRSPVYLEKIKSSKTALIFDATAYYRQIYTHQSAWNLSMFQITNGKTYLDITLRMGHVNSSLSAQRVSDLKDWLFNNSQPYAGIGLTNQDDCIIIDSNGHSEQKFRHFAENLGIAINESKNQAGSVVTWCGYDLQGGRH